MSFASINIIQERKMKKRIISIALIITLIFATLCGCSSKNNKTCEYADQYIELHLHLDGAITVDIAKKLADIQNITLPCDTDEELEKLLTVPSDCTSLNDFLECFELPVSLMQTYDGLKEAAYLVAEDMKNQGVIYAEIRWAPQLHTTQGMTQEEAVQAVLDGLAKSELKCNVILCCMRGEGNEAENLETLEIAKNMLVEDGGVVAVDIAGAEALYPTSDYKELFERAKEYGIPFTIHAGEADGAESVRLAVEYGAKRIGHGVRSYEDEEVLTLLKENGIFLEMCPTSNRQTFAIENMDEYPFIDYLNMGIRVTLNTDDPAIEGTTLADEFRYMEEKFGLTAEQERIILANSVDAAFTSDEVKNELRIKLGLSE